MNDHAAAKTEAGLAKAAAYLAGQQGRDGGWHSRTYGQLKDGAAVTSLALYALSHLPAASAEKIAAPIQRAFDFLAPGLAKRKTVASPDGSLDYPTYAAALWLISRRRLAMPIDNGTAETLRDYLLSAQVAQERGFDANHPQYGGWDFLGQEDAQGITTGTNISVTRYVLEALAGAPADRRVAQAIDRGKQWVLRCQQPDGGFCFTTEPMSLSNKAGYLDDKRQRPRSYGTATCDGIAALMAAGLPPDNERIAKAVGWLANHEALEVVPGFENLPPELGWQRGLRFYYYAALAPLMRQFSEPNQSARRKTLERLLLAAQKSDGSFASDSDRMRENDPLIATPLAMVALAEIISPAPASAE